MRVPTVKLLTHNYVWEWQVLGRHTLKEAPWGDELRPFIGPRIAQLSQRIMTGPNEDNS